MKIYTKTGDEGLTSLFGGARISKDDIRIEAYGTVDELNTFVAALYDQGINDDIRTELFEIQNLLFNMGSVLATDPEKDFNLPGIKAHHIEALELAIDRMDGVMPPLKNFILPSGHVVVSACHICRTVCRRAERRVISLQRHSAVDRNIIIYLNRLSDYFFVLARYMAFTMGIAEVKWNPSS